MANMFADNRSRLIASLKGGVIVLGAYTKVQQTNDMAFPFRQEANFWWLSGIEAPDWMIIIDGTRKKTWLVAPNISRVHQLFDGSLSEEEALRISGADDVLTSDDATTMLRELAAKHSVVYGIGAQPHAEYFDFSLNPAPKRIYDMLTRTFNSVQDCRKDMAKLRAIKQPEEIARLKKAIKLTTTAFSDVKAHLNEFKHEYNIEAEFSYKFRSFGAEGHAYSPIIASGKNATTLHYEANNAKLKQSDLLLLDVGAQLNGYPADITRTYSLGAPTQRQCDVHAAVNDAHAEIISLIAPDVPLEEYQRSVDVIMKRSLMELGLLKSKTDEETYRTYFPHAISHGLGVDTHDSLGAPRVFQPGMVLTVEPGIYIPKERIGVRIEDDILVTPKGHSNLSGHLSTEL